MFSKNRAAAQPSGSNTVAGSTFSVFGADTRIKGDVAASADLHVDGRIEGDVTCTSLVQGEAAALMLNSKGGRLDIRLRPFRLGAMSLGICTAR